ncbi:MAG: hypothetical protein WA996_17415 [Candidatus Promineifilaceae bacterium]
MNSRTNLFVALNCLMAGLVLILVVSEPAGVSVEAVELTPVAYMPLIAKSTCPQASSNHYVGGTAFQVEHDDPVRPANNHADKNIELRGYQPNPDPNVRRGLVDYGLNDPTPPPQFATLFSPYRVPAFVEVYQVGQWHWAPSPEPGSRGDLVSSPPVTVLGLATTPGEELQIPHSGYDIGGGMEVILLFADEDTLALRYGREDSAGAHGFTVHIDNICPDPNLLALYAALDAPGGSRYVYKPPHQRPYAYQLPNLAAGQPLGIARDSEVVVAIVDSGTFLDPRSCDDWWQIRPGYGACP